MPSAGYFEVMQEQLLSAWMRKGQKLFAKPTLKKKFKKKHGTSQLKFDKNVIFF